MESHNDICLTKGKSTMKQINAGDTLSLSIPERIILVEEIWDTIVAEYNNDSEITEYEKEIIDQRLDAYRRNPQKISEWKEVYTRIIESNEL